MAWTLVALSRNRARSRRKVQIVSRAAAAGRPSSHFLPFAVCRPASRGEILQSFVAAAIALFSSAARFASQPPSPNERTSENLQRVAFFQEWMGKMAISAGAQYRSFAKGKAAI